MPVVCILRFERSQEENLAQPAWHTGARLSNLMLPLTFSLASGWYNGNAVWDLNPGTRHRCHPGFLHPLPR